MKITIPPLPVIFAIIFLMIVYISIWIIAPQVAAIITLGAVIILCAVIILNYFCS